MKRTFFAGATALLMAVLSPAADSRLTVLPPGAGQLPGAVIELRALGPNGAGGSDINQWGLVTGTTDTSNGNARAFRAWPNGSMQLLRTLGGPYGNGIGINDLGDVVGESMTADGMGTAFAQIGPAIYDMNMRSTIDINNLRVAAGWTSQAAVWSRDRGLSLLFTPSLPTNDEGGGWRSAAFAGINDRGQAAGFYVDEAGTPHAVRWEADGAITPIGIGTPTAINEAGDVVAWGYNGPPFLWREASGRTSLPWTMLPLGLNDVGQLVGICGNETSSYDACLWTRFGGIVRLTKPVEGYARAEAINDFGEVVGSLGEWSGPGHALWWYMPPEVDQQLSTARTLLRILRDDGAINSGRYTAIAGALKKADRAWRASDRTAAAKWLAHAGQLLGFWRRSSGGNRLVHLEALVQRLSVRVGE